MFKKIMRFIWDNFAAGIVAILPISITILIIRFLVIKVNSFMLIPLLNALDPNILREEQRLILAKSTVFLSVIGIIVFIGLMTRVIFVRRVFAFFERFLFKFPIINKIYGSTKEISRAFLGSKKSNFKQVVLIEYPRKGVFTLGFVTSESSRRIHEPVSGDNLLNIYVPTTPNPTSGLYILLRKEDVTPLDISVEEALKTVISAGVIAPADYKKNIEEKSGDTKV